MSVVEGLFVLLFDWLFLLLLCFGCFGEYFDVCDYCCCCCCWCLFVVVVSSVLMCCWLLVLLVLLLLVIGGVVALNL